MRPFSLLASGIVGIGVALGNPSSTSTFLSRFDTGQSLPPFQLSTLQGASTHPNELEERVLILKFLATLC